MNEEQFILFWDGPFSQWYPCSFRTIDAGGQTVIFNCAEQFMMVSKAIFFEDHEIAREIMQTELPNEQKQLGRQVKNFDADKWNEVARDIVYSGSFLKFGQDDRLYKQLIDTHPATLVEASPYDRIWGIGLKEDHPDALCRSKWRGTNWLGQVLTELRIDLMADNIDHARLSPGTNTKPFHMV